MLLFSVTEEIPISVNFFPYSNRKKNEKGAPVRNTCQSFSVPPAGEVKNWHKIPPLSTIARGSMLLQCCVEPKQPKGNN